MKKSELGTACNGNIKIESQKGGGYAVELDGQTVSGVTELSLHMKVGKIPTVKLRLLAFGEIGTTIDCVFVKKEKNAPVQEGRSKGTG